MLKIYIQIKNRLSNLDDAGQSTAEYSLVLLGAAAVALLLLSWTQSTGAIGDLFDTVIQRVTAKSP